MRFVVVNVVMIFWFAKMTGCSLSNNEEILNKAECGCDIKRYENLGDIYSNDLNDPTTHTQDCRKDSKDNRIMKSPAPMDTFMDNLENVSNLNEKMVFILGRVFYMGTNNPVISGDGESPRRTVSVSSFMMDQFEVSNANYKEFVDSTRYQTDSEKYGWSFVVDRAVAETTRRSIKSAVQGAEWWLPVNGAYWREPEGPGSDVFSKKNDRSSLPAVHISWTDAVRFCSWRNGSRLPTEAEWELAARGSQDGVVFPWGNKLLTNETHRANIFQGDFPIFNTKADGYEFLAPVDAFGPQTDSGLYNMIGNAWEWVFDWWGIDHSDMLGSININPTGPQQGTEKVKKGGSFLCHKSFCYRYRNAARFKSSIDSATQNVGFRCAKSL
jgi:sulfatase modifying factor 1